MSAKRYISRAAVVAAAAASTIGCTSLHQAGSIAGLNRQITAKPPAASSYDLEVPVPPPPGVTEAHPYFAEAGQAPSLGWNEPGCEAPFLREPTCEAPIYREPTCAAPARPCPPPCPPAPCPCQEKPPEAAPLPQPQGCLAMGGGAVTIPLPTIQLPGFFRVPAFRHAVIPVAEPTLVGVPTAVAPAVTTTETAVVQAPVRVVEEVTQEVALVEERARDRVVVDAEVLEELIARARTAETQETQETGETDDALQCMTREDMLRLIELAKKGASDCKASGTPTPASSSDAEIKQMRETVQQYQRDIDELIKQLQESTPK